MVIEMLITWLNIKKFIPHIHTDKVSSIIPLSQYIAVIEIMLIELKQDSDIQLYRSCICCVLYSLSIKESIMFILYLRNLNCKIRLAPLNIKSALLCYLVSLIQMISNIQNSHQSRSSLHLDWVQPNKQSIVSYHLTVGTKKEKHNRIRKYWSQALSEVRISQYPQQQDS